MFPGVCRTRPQHSSETSDNGRDSTRQPAVVSLELKATAVRCGHTDVECSRYRQRKPRNRSFSPLHLDVFAARNDAGSSQSLSETKATSCRSVLTSEIMSPVTTVSRDGLLCDSSQRRHRIQLVADPAASPASTTNRNIAVAHLPPLLNADSECRISYVKETTPRMKPEEVARPFEVHALRLNPDIKSMSTRAHFHQQQSTVGVTNDNNNMVVSAMSSLSSHTERDASTAAKFDTSLPLSDNDDEDEEKDDDDDDDDQEMAEYRHSGRADKMSTGRSVDCDTPGVTEDSCPIISVRIEFCKPRVKQNNDDNATPSSTRQSGSGCTASDDGGGRRRLAGRKNAKIASKPMSPSKAISVAGRGKVVVINDGVYDQFARRQPPKYVSNRTFDGMLNKRAFSKT